MKKSLICGAASLLMAATPALTFATAPDDLGGTHNVTVGEVDEPIYSVSISWGDLSFDWKYDSADSNFNFVPHYRCDEEPNKNYPSIREFYKAANNLYSDASCENLYTGTITSGQGTYYISTPLNSIQVADSSINGKIKATASFAPEEKYSWVSGVFGREENQYVDPAHNEPQNTGFQAYTDGVFPDVNTVCGPESCAEIYAGFLRLVTSDVPVGSRVVAAGDKIGTVTISISPDAE